MRYTWRQFRGYLGVARRRQGADAHQQFVMMLAAQAGGDSARALLRELREASEG